MARDACKMSGCDREPGSEDTDKYGYRDYKFCSPKCELKYEHIREDARDARMAEKRESEDPHGARPDGPPY